ncbi:MAG: hypothetical protein GX941_09580 [Candidatus Methanofastidiosa archaeon]|jgi:hypothetical protein|nr:hypothetical protein [Candidatus Methanofastidiosa archaeon]
MVYLIAILLLILAIQYLIYNKKHSLFTETINKTIFQEHNPVKAFELIEKEIIKSNNAERVNLLSLKFYVSVWLGYYYEAYKTLEQIQQRKRYKKICRIEFYTLLLAFFTNENELITELYNDFLSKKGLKKTGMHNLEFRIIECLYAFHVERNYNKYLEIFEEIKSRGLKVVIYLAMLYFYAGKAKLELGEIIESILYFSKSKVYGQHTFFNAKARDVLMKIKDEADEQNRKKVIDTIETSINQAYLELEEVTESLAKQTKK